MADKDLNEINAIKDHSPHANILLCKFHEMKYFKRKVSDLNLLPAEKQHWGYYFSKSLTAKIKNIMASCTMNCNIMIQSVSSSTIETGMVVKVAGSSIFVKHCKHMATIQITRLRVMTKTYNIM